MYVPIHSIHTKLKSTTPLLHTNTIANVMEENENGKCAVVFGPPSLVVYILCVGKNTYIRKQSENTTARYKNFPTADSL